MTKRGVYELARALNVLVALSLVPLLGSCGASGFVVTGQVIDSGTGKPMPNVWVHQEWVVRERFSIPIADKGAAGTFPCVDEQVTKTDSNGRFRFERPPKLSYNPITEFPRALLRPLIPAYEHDHERSNGTGESKQIVAVKKTASPPTREGYILGMTWFLVGGGKCQQVGAARTMLNVEISEEAANDLSKSGVTLIELGEAIRKSRSMSWGYKISDAQLNEDDAYRIYKSYLERKRSSP